MTDVGTDPGALRAGSPEAIEQVRLHRERVSAQEAQAARRREETDPAFALARIEAAVQRIELALQKETDPRGRLPFRLFRRR